jgi:hypothetical protein
LKRVGESEIVERLDVVDEEEARASHPVPAKAGPALDGRLTTGTLAEMGGTIGATSSRTTCQVPLEPRPVTALRNPWGRFSLADSDKIKLALGGKSHGARKKEKTAATTFQPLGRG